MELVGRSSALQELRELLELSGCAVITGPPGIGKTALASVVPGACWVDLEGVSAPGAVLGQLAAALSCPTEQEAAVLEAAGRVEVVVLDGAEDAADALVELVPALARRCSVLITARTRLDLDAPVLELGPLTLQAGVELVRRELRSVRRAADLDDAELGALVDALDGVPLALTLAAKRLRLYAPEQVRDQGFRRLRDPRRPERQHLLAAVEQSCAAVSAAAGRVLGVAALLTTFDAPLLEGVAGEPVDEALLELLDASLVHPLAGARFRVLAPIRASVLPAVERATRQRALVRLAEVVLGSAEEAAERLDAPIFEPADLAATTPLLELLTTSADPAVRLRAALVLAAREREAGAVGRTLERDDHLADEGPDRLRVRWAFAVDGAASSLGDTRRARAALDRVDDVLDDEERAASLSSRAMLHQTEGDAPEALRLAQAAIALGTDPWLHFRYGAVLLYQGRFEEAEVALRRAQQVPSAFRSAQATCQLCRVLRHRGAPPADVLAELQPRLELADRASWSWLGARIYQLHGVVSGDLGEVEPARASLRRSWELKAAQGIDALGVLIDLYSVDYLDGRVPTEVLEPKPDPKLPEERAWLDLARATAHAMLGHHAAAEALGLPAVELLRARTDPALAELGAALSVALLPGRPETAANVRAALPDGALAALVDAILAGGLPEPGPRLEQRVVCAIARMHLGAVEVATDGSRFVGVDGQPVDIARRRVLRRVLAALAGSDEGRDVDQLCAEVWPGERLIADSGTRRVHVAISTLRGLGLRQAIRTVTRDDGTTAWRLDARRVTPG